MAKQSKADKTKQSKTTGKTSAKKPTLGRPPKYKSPLVLQQKISEYINDSTIKPTISGLAYHLGFCSRTAFYDMEKKPDFQYTIKRARLFMESYYEGNLVGNNCTGSIFALKNFGWVDKTEHDLGDKAIKTVLDIINGSTKGTLPSQDPRDSSKAS